MSKLDAQPQSVTVKVITIRGIKKHHIDCACGLIVTSLDGSVQISLAKAYIKEDLPVDHKEIISVETIQQFDYLRRITNEMQHYPKVSDQDQVPIALIIGSNCPKAVEPIECIPSQDSGPYAYRSRLGWCVAGPSRNSDPQGIICNRIHVEDVTTSSVAQHKFVVKNQLKDVSIGDQLKEMYLTDFNEHCSERKSLSVEDRKFIERITGRKVSWQPP